MNEYEYRIPLFGPNYLNSRIIRIIRDNTAIDWPGRGAALGAVWLERKRTEESRNCQSMTSYDDSFPMSYWSAAVTALASDWRKGVMNILVRAIDTQSPSPSRDN